MVKAIGESKRSIGPIGTGGRLAAGLALLLLAAWSPEWWGDGLQWPDLLLGLVAFPLAVLGVQALRLRFSDEQIVATNRLAFYANIAIGVAVFSHPSTRAAAALFIGVSLLIAAVRGYAGCEVTAISNWILRRDDQIGCIVFSPLDRVERRLSPQDVQQRMVLLVVGKETE